MGDVKMLAALGAWLGPVAILIAFGIAAFIASVMAVSMMIHSTFTKGVTKTKKQYLAAASSGRPASGGKKTPPRRAKRVLPFAVPVALSTWLLLGWVIFKHSM